MAGKKGGKYRDFNQFITPVEPITFDYLDEHFEIAGKIPFQPMLEAMAKEDDTDEGLAQTDVIRLLSQIMGEKEHQRLMAVLDVRHADVVLMGIIEMVMEDFTEKAEAGEVEELDGGKAQRLRRKLQSRRSTSSSTGPESKPTSAGIMLSEVTRSGS